MEKQFDIDLLAQTLIRATEYGRSLQLFAVGVTVAWLLNLIPLVLILGTGEDVQRLDIAELLQTGVFMATFIWGLFVPFLLPYPKPFIVYNVVLTGLFCCIFGFVLVIPVIGIPMLILGALNASASLSLYGTLNALFIVFSPLAITLLPFMMQFQCVRGGFATFRMRALDKTFVLGPASRYSAKLFDFPPFSQFAGRKKYLTYALIVLADCVTAFAVYFAMFAPVLTATQVSNALGQRGSGGGGDFIVVMIAGLAMAAVSTILFFPLTLLGNRITRWARRISRVSALELMSADQRRPIVFLRSFQDDRVELRRYRFNFVGRMMHNARFPDNVDHLLIEEGVRYGPVIALGKPGEQVAPFGSARLYASHETWKSEVIALCKRAFAIILIADPTPGLVWERELVTTDSELRGKTLVLRSPRHSVLPQAGSEKNDEFEGSNKLALDWSAKDGLEVITSERQDNICYLMALRRFLMTHDPRPKPRWDLPPISHLFAWVATALAFGTIATFIGWPLVHEVWLKQ